MKKIFFLISISFFSLFTFAQDNSFQQRITKSAIDIQPYLLSNEKLIFSFRTEKNKILTICTDTNNKYIVYRFGSENEVELQYPKMLDSTSWDNFYYYNYHRGGGIDNAGMDEASLSFIINNFNYKIYEGWAIDKNGEHESLEIEIDDLATKTDSDIIIAANKKSKKGSLIDLRFSKLSELLNSAEKEAN